MSSDSSPTSETWHAELAEKDRTVRSGIDAFSVEAENAALHQRLDALMAELRIARAAVGVRDAALREREPLLREQTEALRERDAELAQAKSELAVAKSELETILATRSWRYTRRAAQGLRAPRRLFRR
jgi:chromosome segregation ATPase